MIDRTKILPEYQQLTDDELNSDLIPFTRIRRITGYLVGDMETRFNNAKRAEERDRVKHGVTNQPKGG